MKIRLKGRNVIFRERTNKLHTRNKNRATHADRTPVAPARPIEVVFAFERTEANQVYLCGDFNEWSATTLPMIRRGDRLWLKSVTLPPGVTNTSSSLTESGLPIQTPPRRSSMPSGPLIRWRKFNEAAEFKSGSSRRISQMKLRGTQKRPILMLTEPGPGSRE